MIIILQRSIYCYDEQVEELYQILDEDHTEIHIENAIERISREILAINPDEFTGPCQKVVYDPEESSMTWLALLVDYDFSFDI